MTDQPSPPGIPAALVGATGLVGAHLLTTLLAHPSISALHVLTRKPLPPSPDPSSRLQATTEPDSESWPALLPTTTPPPSIFFSALATTRGIAGGFEAQKKIDLDLNVALAKAAKAAGTRTYVLISSSGATETSAFAYPRMKAQLERDIALIGFENTVFLRPGLITGQRRSEDSRPAEYAARMVAEGLGKVSGGWLKDRFAQDADVIARAAVQAGLTMQAGEVEGGEGRGVKKTEKGRVWEIGMAEIMKLGRTEWKA